MIYKVMYKILHKIIKVFTNLRTAYIAVLVIKHPCSLQQPQHLTVQEIIDG